MVTSNNASDVVLELQATFPAMDSENIEEALAACGGNAAQAAAVLRDVLEEEAAEAAKAEAEADGATSMSPPITLLRVLLDVVVSVAQTPADQRTEQSRARMATFLARLEASGIALTDPVGRILDGERDTGRLVEGLDDADAEVVRQLLALIRADVGSQPSGELSEAEKTDLVVGFGTSSQRLALQAVVARNQADLAQKQEATELLKRAVIKQRLEAPARS